MQAGYLLATIQYFCKKIKLTETIIYASAAFVTGFILAWLLRTLSLSKLQKELKSTKGFLESERLMKETLNKENIMVHQQKQYTELDYQNKLKEALAHNKLMDENILLLQKSNEETEALLQAGQPVVHELKMKLIEANNSIARLKAMLEEKK